MYVNIVHGAPKDSTTYEWSKDVQTKAIELNERLQQKGQWALIYTHRLDENESGDNLLVFPNGVDGNQVLATLLDLVMDMVDRKWIVAKNNGVVGGLAYTLELLYKGKTTTEITKTLEDIAQGNTKNVSNH